jgi:phosphate-selective porin OprO/OprP
MRLLQEPGAFEQKTQESADEVGPALPKQTDAQAPAPKPKPPVEFPTVRITGFTQFDGDWNSQTPKNMATVGDIQDGVGFRRARLSAVGRAAEQTNYMIEMDFAAAGRPSFFDVWAEQENLPALGTVRAGQYVQPFSVDAMSGFRHLVFLERSLPFFAFVPFRRVGVEAYGSSDDEKTNVACSVFRTGGFNNAPLGDDRFATDIGDMGGYSFSTRLTRLIYFDEHSEDRYLWHVGASYNYSRLGANTAAGSPSPRPFYQARTTPEFFMGSPEAVPPTFGPSAAFAGTPVFVDTGRYLADNFQILGVETLWQNGPVSFQAEWMGTLVDSAVGSIFYNGAYAQVAYRLTGENRVYYKKIAAFGNAIPYTNFFSVKPGRIKGWGAWEIAIRWSFVELKNPTRLDGSYIAGTNASGNGTLNDFTLGLTWFMNEHLKFQVNWIHAMLDNTAKGFSQADLFVTRLQVDY